jgi:uncharacterized membrane protein YbaN (DUF454 family)
VSSTHFECHCRRVVAAAVAATDHLRNDTFRNSCRTDLMLRHTQMLMWRLVALVSMAVGIVGIALPVIPTVPFVILAAFAGGKGWPALERWLLQHPTYGRHVRIWRERGAVPRNAKVVATLMMVGSAIGLQFVDSPLAIRILAPVAMGLVAIWLWSRPNQ